MKNSNISVILGTMAFGGPDMHQQKAKVVLDFLEKMNPGGQLDTAILYQHGKTEKCLGKLNIKEKNFQVAAKVNSFYPNNSPSRGLGTTSLREQFHLSLKNLNLEKVALLYLHWPDYETPIEETIEAIHELDTEGKFDEWGLSNYPAWQVVDIYHLCKEKGYKVPTVYQGMYNYLTRSIESELFPAIRRCGMRFCAYNPLAGGLLTGRYSFSDSPETGRFDVTTPWGVKYRDRYWKSDIFGAIDAIKEEIQQAKDVSLIDVAYRWLFFHSKLQPGDAIIIGGSSIEQINSNFSSLSKLESLNESTLKCVENGWNLSKGNCVPYFR